MKIAWRAARRHRADGCAALANRQANLAFGAG
jgi:hypothetical protein